MIAIITTTPLISIHQNSHLTEIKDTEKCSSNTFQYPGQALPWTQWPPQSRCTTPRSGAQRLWRHPAGSTHSPGAARGTLISPPPSRTCRGRRFKLSPEALSDIYYYPPRDILSTHSPAHLQPPRKCYQIWCVKSVVFNVVRSHNDDFQRPQRI